MTTQIRLIVLASLAITAILMLCIITTRVVYNNFHMSDMFLLTDLGWRSLNGLRAVVDYTNFFGGVTATFVGTSFALFGATTKAVDYALVLMFLVVALSIALMTPRRISVVTAALVAMICASVLLTWNPIEAGPIQGMNAAHSYVYNHFAIGLMAALAIFALFPSEDRRAEFGGAILCGLLLYVLMLTKPTFVVYVPFFLLALLVQARWLSCGIAVLATIVTMLAIDFGGTRLIGSFDYATMAMSSRAEGGMAALIKHTILFVLEQTLALAVAFVFLCFGYWMLGRSALPFLISMLLLGVGYIGTAATMGANPRIQFTPWLFLTAAFVIERVRQSRPDMPPFTVWTVFLLSLAHAVPITLSSIATVGLSYTKGDLRLIDDGPVGDYFVNGSIFSKISGEDDIDTRRQKAFAIARDQLETGAELDDSFRYVSFVDGLLLLREIANIEQYGIVANGRIYDFSFATQSRPVASYPVWPSERSPELNETDVFGDDVDMVMIPWPVTERNVYGGLLTEQLVTRMGAEFAECRSSNFWTLYVRHHLEAATCG